MLDVATMDKVDARGMYKIYDSWPEIARKSYESNHEPVDFHDIDHIVFAGMGGSGTIGDLFSSILSKSDIHVSLIKGYLLPKTVDKNTLVITTSISGNTSETLTVLDSAAKLDCRLIAFSSGGKMEDMCKKNQIKFRKIPLIHSPRTSLVSFTYSILKTLNSALPIKKNDIVESLDELDIMKKQIFSHNLSDSNPSINLANWISGIPIIYYPHGLQSTATRFKSSLQENAKIHAITEDIIEACHNGMVSWEKPSTVQPILLQGKDDYIKTKERFDIIKEFFMKKDIDFKEIHSVSGNILTKIISLIYMLDYVSIYKAVLSKTDPSPVLPIDYIKSRLDTNNI
ncbi:SIS domain-containing protein [Nitrosarchaeum koreense]|uniref:Glucose-6-phosphate isomerase n=1 Tax=Nitrosarchaeum koreense MY1 TaxID=1001994 RepID=F9CYC2_9ARCH|nr:SIS domain-containing protein [Nitrosarchaeum koreense]EGP92900.1 Glucose-6-phosphate isomerase [Nitrosarchaeum koreense MY1]